MEVVPPPPPPTAIAMPAIPAAIRAAQAIVPALIPPAVFFPAASPAFAAASLPGFAASGAGAAGAGAGADGGSPGVVSGAGAVGRGHVGHSAAPAAPIHPWADRSATQVTAVMNVFKEKCSMAILAYVDGLLMKV